MKKTNIMATIAVVAFAGVHVYRSLPASSELSDLQLENLEALAQDQDSEHRNSSSATDCDKICEPNTNWCCELLHPTDSKQDIFCANKVWPGVE